MQKWYTRSPRKISPITRASLTKFPDKANLHNNQAHNELSNKCLRMNEPCITSQREFKCATAHTSTKRWVNSLNRYSGLLIQTVSPLSYQNGWLTFVEESFMNGRVKRKHFPHSPNSWGTYGDWAGIACDPLKLGLRKPEEDCKDLARNRDKKSH